MFAKKTHSFPIIESVIAFFVFVLHYTELIDITIYTASPFILLPLCAVIGIFRGEVSGLIFGTVCGLACDSVASSTVIFNTLSLMVIGFLAGVLAKNIFNKNFKSALALSFIFSGVYFALKWFIFYLLPDVQGKVYNLLWHCAPCALYTALFIIPFFFLEKRILSERKPKGKLYIR